jgi:hypothetical protein
MSVRELDVIPSVSFMGHARLGTTQRYLNAQARCNDADRLTRAFAGKSVTVAHRRRKQKRGVALFLRNRRAGTTRAPGGSRSTALYDVNANRRGSPAADQ